MDFLLAEAMRAEACAEKCFFCGDHLITTKPVSGTCLGPHEVCLSGIAGLVLAAGPRAGDLEAPGSGPPGPPLLQLGSFRQKRYLP